jgi:hypothetical protein
MGVPHEQAMLLRLAEPKGKLHQGNGSLFLSPRSTFMPSARFELKLGRLLGAGVDAARASQFEHIVRWVQRPILSL